MVFEGDFADFTLETGGFGLKSRFFHIFFKKTLASCFPFFHKFRDPINQDRETMANYDAPGLFYDSGVLYDMVSLSQPKKTKWQKQN